MCMKKIGAFLLAGCLLCVGAQVLLEQNAVSITAKAEDLMKSEEGYWFSVYDDYAVCVGTVDEVSEVVIPEIFKVDEKVLEVTKVGEYFFKSFKSADTISSLHIGANIKSIEGAVFQNCSLLTEIEIPEGLEVIKGSSFSGCSFETLTFPKSLKSLTGNAFTKNENLKSVTFLGGNSEEGLVISDPYAVNSPFAGCTNLETVIMNEGVTKLESCAFSKLPALKNVQIPSTLTEIGDSAFCYCTALEEIEIPSSVESIEAYAFQHAENLKTVTLHEGLKTIGKNAFQSTALEEITIPATVEKIEGQMFQNTLKKITFLRKDIPISVWTGIPKTCVICGYTGSTAQTFAEKNGYTFEALDAEPAQEILLGDADQNGEVDILDVISINKAILGKENLSENGLKAIDFNGNEKPDSDEAMQVLKFIVGMIENFNA